MIGALHIFNALAAGVAHGLAPMTFWAAFCAWRELVKIRRVLEASAWRELMRPVREAGP
jgi:hypothetical protein